MKPFALAFILCVATPAHALIFTVTNTNDSGAGSLRDAIAQANTSPGPDAIAFASNLTGTITLTSGQIQISDGLTITGPGSNKLTIDANANSRIFSIFATDPACPALDGPDYLVSISGVTLTNARRTTSNAAGAIFTEHSLALDGVTIQNSVAANGGGVSFFVQYAGQSLTINNSVFTGNTAQPLAGAANAFGGALAILERCAPAHTTPVTVTISNSDFNANQNVPSTLNGFGGAIASDSFADITITDTRIRNNSVNLPQPTPPASQIYRGGGIYAHAKSLTIVRSEIAGNSLIDASGSDLTRGGGLILFNNADDLQDPAHLMTVKIINSTISGNASPATAGAMLVNGNVAVEIYNTTISDNSAATNRTGGIVVTTGATVPPSASNATTPTLKLASTILANSQGGVTDLSTNLATIPSFTVDATNSLIETVCPSPNCEITIPPATNLIGVDPQLGSLAFSGGTTRTHAILVGSPVINAGANPLALTTDQRGTSFARASGAAADMGAFELQPPTLLGVRSRKVHGPAGPFDLLLNAVPTTPTVEPRQGPAQTIVFMFNSVVTAGLAQVTEGTAVAGAPTFSGNEMIVPLTGVANQQYVSVAVSNVAAGGGTGGSGSIRLGYLLGDVSGNRVVTVSDVAQVNGQVAQTVIANNFLKDINATGTLTVGDKGITNTQVTKALPAP